MDKYIKPGDTICAQHIGYVGPITGVVIDIGHDVLIELMSAVNGTIFPLLNAGDRASIWQSDIFRVYRNGVEYYTTGLRIGRPVTADIDRYFPAPDPTDG